MKSRGKPHIAVFFGGTSESRDLSEDTGYWICEHIPRSRFGVTPVRVTADGMWQVPLGGLPERGSVRPVLRSLFAGVPAVHPVQGLERLLQRPIAALMTVVRGEGGDDGALHGLGMTLQIPVIGSSLNTCQRTSDKQACSDAVESVIGSPRSELFIGGIDPSEELIDDIRDSFKPPFFVKPVRSEGSAGAQEVMSLDELRPALRHVLASDDALVQERHDGQEVSVSLFTDQRGNVHILPPTVVIPRRSSFFDELAKRRGGRVDLITSRPDHNPLLHEAEAIARDVYDELQCDGLVTIDLMQNDDVTTFLEANTVPTFTPLSPLWHQLRSAKIQPGVLLHGLIERSIG